MRAAILLIVTACNLDKPILGDASVGGDDDTCSSFSTQIDTCQLPPAANAIAIAENATYETGSGMLVIGGKPVPVQHQQGSGPSGVVDILVGTSFALKQTATLRVTGSIIGILSEGEISIDGAIDVSVGGAGARATCVGSAAGAGLDGNPGGGGGGGGFGSAGGDGSAGGGGIMGGAGGGLEPVPPLVAGGCPGGDGGTMSPVTVAGGAGGGAIFIASRQPMTITGRILAGGGGGKGGSMMNPGGGGGGSGGMILVESPTTMVGATAIVVANGGGGGEGGGGNMGFDGQDGQAAAIPASGGTGGSLAGDGGDGAIAQREASGGAPTMSPTAGGGGGGGGVGNIVITNASIAVGAIVSPAAGSVP